MKNHFRKKQLTLGDLIADAHSAWGKRQANGMVRLAVKAGLVKFKAPQRSITS